MAARGTKSIASYALGHDTICGKVGLQYVLYSFFPLVLSVSLTSESYVSVSIFRSLCTNSFHPRNKIKPFFTSIGLFRSIILAESISHYEVSDLAYFYRFYFLFKRIAHFL